VNLADILLARPVVLPDGRIAKPKPKTPQRKIEANRAWRAANPEKVKAIRAQEDKEKKRAREKEWRAKNPDYMKRWRERTRAEDPEAYAKQKRAAYKKWVKNGGLERRKEAHRKDPEKALAKQREFRALNKARVLKQRRARYEETKDAINARRRELNALKRLKEEQLAIRAEKHRNRMRAYYAAIREARA
jgi:hypothetical protein